MQHATPSLALRLQKQSGKPVNIMYIPHNHLNKTNLAPAPNINLAFEEGVVQLCSDVHIKIDQRSIHLFHPKFMVQKQTIDSQKQSFDPITIIIITIIHLTITQSIIFSLLLVQN